MGLRSLLSTVLALVLVLVAACRDPELDEPTDVYVEAPPERVLPSPESIVREATEARPEDVPRQVDPAAGPDGAYTDASPQPARRIVYRFTLRFIGMGERDPTLPLPGGELSLDVTGDRLRATFLGNGWPVPTGSQVRMRLEQSGTYVFDNTRGRPLVTGALSVWFSGGRVTEQVELNVRREARDDEPHIAAMVCRFFAELTAAPVDRMARRCAEGGMPTLLRVGPYLVDRTADVGVVVPRASLRADERDPPPRAYVAPNRPFLVPEEIAQIAPVIERPERDPHGAEPPPRGLRVENRSDARVLVTVNDTPLGYLDAGAELVFDGLADGAYIVGARRPLGGRRLRPKHVLLPAHVRFGP